jgi:hypothetical protein
MPYRKKQTSTIIQAIRNSRVLWHSYTLCAHKWKIGKPTKGNKPRTQHRRQRVYKEAARTGAREATTDVDDYE